MPEINHYCKRILLCFLAKNRNVYVAHCMFREILHNEVTLIFYHCNSEDMLQSNEEISSNYGFLQLFIILLEISIVNLSLNNRYPCFKIILISIFIRLLSEKIYIFKME